MFRNGIGLAVCVLAAGAAAQAAQAPSGEVLRERLEAELAAAAASVDGVMGYAVIDLESGARFGALDDRPFPTASTIKVAILYELVRQAEEGRLRLDEPAPLDRRFVVGGAGILQQLTAPSLSLRDHAILMMVLSDNTATNVVIDAVGRDAVDRRMGGLGLPGIRLRRPMMDTEAALRGDENVASPRDLARLLELVYRGDGLTPKGRETLLDILTRAKSSAIRRTVPESVTVGSKPGSLEGVRVDAGLVLLDDRPYILAVMCTYLLDDEEGERAIERASQAVWNYFSRVARGGSYGRQIGR